MCVYRERERETLISCLPYTPDHDWTHHLGKCPDQESNPQPFGAWTIFWPTEPPGQGHQTISHHSNATDVLKRLLKPFQLPPKFPVICDKCAQTYFLTALEESELKMYFFRGATESCRWWKWNHQTSRGSAGGWVRLRGQRHPTALPTTARPSALLL